ncbi:hypothetical protein D3C72_1670890 [compost metagenome]
MTGRRPYWSDSEPITGEARNCIPAHSATKTPFSKPARAFEPTNSSIRCGSTGMTIPMATMSSTAVTKMKAIAARRTLG